MNNTLRSWLNPLVSHPERLNLWACLLVTVFVVKCIGPLLSPIILSLVIAYLLQWLVVFLQRHLHLPHRAAVLITYFAFLGAIVGLYGLIMPLVLRQLQSLLTQLPQLTVRSQAVFTYLHERYPGHISEEQIQSLTGEVRNLMNSCGQWILSSLITSIPDLIALSIYLVLAPLLIYFFLMDQHQILGWIAGFLPQRRRLILEVWTEVYTKTGHYVRGKVVEILIVWVVTAIIFSWMQLPYAILLGLLTGLSAAVPYVGTVVVTVPVAMVGFLEWGWSQELFYLLAVYGLINFLDSHLLFPFLFAEAMSLHPVAIMVATLVFGGLLGFWGVFFSIPLAVLTDSVLNTIKRSQIRDKEEMDHQILSQ
jgi:putative permease